jgi:hypothetical protein
VDERSRGDDLACLIGFGQSFRCRRRRKHVREEKEAGADASGDAEHGAN